MAKIEASSEQREERQMKRATATILREYGPWPDVTHVHGVSYDGTNVWIATGDALKAIDPASGAAVRSLDVPAHAGTAFDGRHLYQISGDCIQKVDPVSGRVISTIPTPDGGASGMAWAEGSLWVGQYRRRKIHEVDPQTGAIIRTLESNRFVTGVTWVQGELWHGTLEAEKSELRRIDPQSGEVLEQLDVPSGIAVSGLESNGRDTFFCGGAGSGKMRSVRRPARGSAVKPQR
jgi:glutamine cyclotransferase